MYTQPHPLFALLPMHQLTLTAFLLVTILGCGTVESISPPSSGMQSPESFLARLAAAEGSKQRTQIVESFVNESRHWDRPYTRDSLVFLWYRGSGRLVTVASDLNQWDPFADTMQRVEETDFFHLTLRVDPSGRFEYKLVVDSTWQLDPENPKIVEGPFGLNSEVCMPRYLPPPEIERSRDIPHGTLDTLLLHSSVLHRTHPVYIYLPHDYNAGRRYPTLYVADGAEYLSRGQMKNILDNLIAARRIPGIVVAFLEPRTDPERPETNMRMVDYGISDKFTVYLATELRDTLMRLYSLLTGPRNTAVMGASLGGLAATYTAWERDDVFGLCAAQSPAYQWKNDTLLTMVAGSPRKEVVFHISTGTIHDAEERSRQMRDILSQRGYRLRYTEHPEGHNWMNWRARISDILTFFWGTE